MENLASLLRHVPPPQLSEKLQGLWKGAFVSAGHFEFPADNELRDLDWNYLDQEHRPWIHRTYQESVRLLTGTDFAVSLVRLKIFGVPVLVTVTDIRVAPSVFYQSIPLFGVFYLHVVTRHTPDRITADWHLLSSKWLRFLHPFFHRRFLQIHQRQNEEDVPLRTRRREMRARGYHFKCDPPNYQNCNVSQHNVIFPKLMTTETIDISQFKTGERVSVSVGPLAFLVENRNTEVWLWPSVCPHEGGVLDGNPNGTRVLRCSWHGLQVPAVVLSATQPSDEISGAVCEWLSGKITFRPAEADTLRRGPLPKSARQPTKV